MNRPTLPMPDSRATLLDLYRAVVAASVAPDWSPAERDKARELAALIRR